MNRKIYTLGHSTRPIEGFIDLLTQNGIKQLVDIRTIPRSRHNPQFEQTALGKSLPKAGIEYIYMKDLGGLRPKVKNSINEAWHNLSFRNYADYMQSDTFKVAIQELIDISDVKLTAIMCAEAVPWRCHRSLVSDALVVRDFDVYEIIDNHQPKKHTLTSFAKVNDTTITYPKTDET